MIVAPSMLAANIKALSEEIEKINNSDASWIHLDIMDGAFVPNTSFDEDLVNKIRKLTTKFLDVHLMTFNPLALIERYKKAGADLITFHYEAEKDPLSVIRKIHANGIKAGISIKPQTKVEAIIEYLPFVDVVLVMSVEPGLGGQKFLTNAIAKVEELKKLKEIKKYPYLIEVDGGINQETAPLVKAKGCDVVVSGSYLFKALSFSKAVKVIS